MVRLNFCSQSSKPSAGTPHEPTDVFTRHGGLGSNLGSGSSGDTHQRPRRGTLGSSPRSVPVFLTLAVKVGHTARWVDSPVVHRGFKVGENLAGERREWCFFEFRILFLREHSHLSLCPTPLLQNQNTNETFFSLFCYFFFFFYHHGNASNASDNRNIQYKKKRTKHTKCEAPPGESLIQT